MPSAIGFKYTLNVHQPCSCAVELQTDNREDVEVWVELSERVPSEQ